MPSSSRFVAMDAAPHAAERPAMESLLRPRKVAVVGATEKPGAPAGTVFRNLLHADFGGKLFPVHPTAASIHGVPAAPRLRDLPEPVDCVVIGLAADKVTSVLEEAADCGARAAVILASGFAELGAEGRERQADLADAAKRAGVAVCGPNCLGLINVARGIPLFSGAEWREIPKGGLAILSHSGSGAISLSASGRLGTSYVVSAGNSAVCDMAEYLDFLAADEETKAAALFMETLRSPEKFEQAVGTMLAAGKPVVALRVGRSASGAAASAAHTGSLVSSDEAFEEFFRRTGVIVVDDMDELIETSCLLTGLKRRTSKPGVGLINVSGGEIAHACDIAEKIGMSFPELAADTVRSLGSILPSFATPRNPLDATGAVFADPKLYPRCIEALASDPSVGLLAIMQDAPVGMGPAGAANYRPIAEHVVHYSRRNAMPAVFITNLAGGVHPDVRKPLDEAGVPVLHGTRAALKAIHHYLTRQTAPTPSRIGETIVPQPKWVARLKAGTAFNENETKGFLADHGIGVTRETLVTNADQCAEAAASLGFPLVLKIASRDLPHKTEVGGVALGVRTQEDAREAYARIMESVARLAPEARIDGVLVQEMVTGGVEAIVGLAQHPPFGLAVVAGSGGVLVEIMRDAALALPPLEPETAHGMIERTKLAALLSGFRGMPTADVDALARLLVSVSSIAVAYGDWIEALDLNPVAVLPAGRGLCVLDALLVCAKTGGDVRP